MGNARPAKIFYYLTIADGILERSTCIRRKYGAVIVKNDQIISTGYNGAPRGRKNCSDLEFCKREELKIPSGTQYELCRSVHAEQNAIISAGREKCLDATLYLSGKNSSDNSYIGEHISCCMMCKRVIINAGIKEVIAKTGPYGYKTFTVSDWINED